MEAANLTIWIAFIAGIASFLSPCVLPLVPGYISLISGVSIDRLKEGSPGTGTFRAVMLNSLAFNLGLSVIFVALGATAGWVGSAFITNRWVRIVGGIIIILFGLQLMGWLKIPALYKDTRFFSSDKPRGALGSLTLGMAFAAGWTPCIGPILGLILGLAASSGNWRSGLVLSAFYSAGLAVPFLLTGLSLNWFLAFYKKFRAHLHKVEVVSGVVLIIVGVLIATNYLTVLASSRLASWIPNAESLIKVTSPPPIAPTANTSFQPAPDVSFQTLAGQPYALNQHKGQVVMLNFWATWCIPCREEIPILNAMQQDHAGKGLKIIGATLEDTAEAIQQYEKEVAKFQYDVVTGSSDVGSKFDATGLPTTYLIDREGRIRQKIIGARDRAGWEAAVKPLLDEGQTTASAAQN